MGTHATTTQPERVETSMLPIQDEEFGYREARHLLWRAGFGGTDEQIRTLAGWGPKKAVDFILDYDDIPFEDDSPTAFDHNIMRARTREENLALRRAQQAGDENTLSKFREMRQSAQRDDRRQMREIRHWWLTRMIQTPRPLEEKMTLFWHGHFATSYRTIEDSYHMYQQNRMLRGLALGNFRDLVLPDVPVVDVVVDLDGVDIRFDQYLRGIIAGMAVGAEHPAAGKEKLGHLVLGKGISFGPNLDLPARQDVDLSGKVLLHQFAEFKGPFLIVVVGDADAVDALGLDLSNNLFRDLNRRRHEIERLPHVGVEVQF